MKIFVYVILGFLFCIANAKKKTSGSSISKEKDNAAQKFNSLLSNIAANSVVSLSDKNFTKYVVDRPREYTAFIMFTATAKQYQCSVCLRAKSNLEEVASYYQQQYDFNSSSVSERIVFFRIEVDDARSAFNEMQLETVPRIYILPPTTESSPKMKISDYEMETKFLIESSAATLSEIHVKTGVKVSLRTSLSEYINNIHTSFRSK
jgi:hypothetical protein